MIIDWTVDNPINLDGGFFRDWRGRIPTVYNVSVNVPISFSPSSSEIADFVRSVAVSLNIDVSPSEVAEFVRSVLVTLNLTPTDSAADVMP